MSDKVNHHYPFVLLYELLYHNYKKFREIIFYLSAIYLYRSSLCSKEEILMEIVTYLNSIFWGWLVAGILLSCGIFYTIRLGFPQIRYFTKLVRNLQTASVNNKGVSAFSALCSAIGSEVGACS